MSCHAMSSQSGGCRPYTYGKHLSNLWDVRYGSEADMPTSLLQPGLMQGGVGAKANPSTPLALGFRRQVVTYAVRSQPPEIFNIQPEGYAPKIGLVAWVSAHDLLLSHQ